MWRACKCPLHGGTLTRRRDVVRHSVYECPAGSVLRLAHVGLEGLCLDREVYRLRDMMASKFTDYCYNGFWFSPEMEFVLHAVEKSQEVSVRAGPA